MTAFAYTHFIRSMAVILDRFGVQYIDIHRDGVFGLFSGSGYLFEATAAASTMRTQVENKITARFKKDTGTDWAFRAGMGIDTRTLLGQKTGRINPSEWVGTLCGERCA